MILSGIVQGSSLTCRRPLFNRCSIAGDGDFAKQRWLSEVLYQQQKSVRSWLSAREAKEDKTLADIRSGFAVIPVSPHPTIFI